MIKKRVLIVDDVMDWRLTLKGLLVDAGFEVEITGSVQAALDALTSHHFDLALLDIRLDETDEENVDGLNLAYEIRKTDPNMKIIILTGYATVENVKKAFRDSFVADFIPKTETADLRKIVQEVLSK